MKIVEIKIYLAKSAKLHPVIVQLITDKIYPTATATFIAICVRAQLQSCPYTKRNRVCIARNTPIMESL